MPPDARPALKIPALVIAVGLLCGTNVTLAQCEFHEDAKLVASDATAFDYFGVSVSVSGDVAVVGADHDNCAAGVYCGAAYVYRFNGSTWVQQAKLAAFNTGRPVFFGHSVFVSGDIAFVGAYGDNCATGSYCGAAYVFRFNGSTWVEEQRLTASDAATGDGFGVSVAVSGDVAVVGAYGDDCEAGIYCGSAYVYRYTGSTWVEEQKLTASDGAEDNRFGASVSISGTVAVIGASYDDCAAGLDCGSAYVYRFNGNSWVQQGKLTASDAAPGDFFGCSVFVSGDTAIVGAPFDDYGAAYVYRFNGSNWVEDAKLTASDAALGDLFGWSVSVTGNTAMVGAIEDDCAAEIDCGSAYVYGFNGNAWVQQAKLTASDTTPSHGPPGDYFGVSVSVSGDVVLVGAYADDCGAAVDCGSAYVYAIGSLPLPSDCNDNGVADECDISDGTSYDCNANGVPDECDIADCTGDPACADCNANGVPDECDLAACTGDPACADCNANSIPDGCEADCNSNAIPDECDIRAGVSRDTDVNGIPDECETGACCDGSTGLCVDDVSMALCDGDQRSWSVNILCAELDPPCAGACCDLLTGGCTENVPPSACSRAQQRWTGGATCNEAACEAVTGACCDHDPFGGCTDGLTRAECDCARCEWTKSALCDDVECPRDSIPTVGAWGLAILALLLITGAKIRFGRIQQT